MKFVKCIISLIIKSVAVLLLTIFAFVTFGFLISPVYNFPEATPFSGEKIYNPYEDFKGSWYKANFHAHTKLNELLNGAQTKEELVANYKSYYYDIIGISDYNTITQHEPESRSEYHIPVYEHGYNISKYHHGVFGEGTETFYDILLPLTASQKQHKMNKVAKRADIICINHPSFSLFFPVEQMSKLRGYRLIEADSGMANSIEYWDEALSSGIISFILSGDDSHDTSRPHDIATQCTWIASKSMKYDHVLESLKEGEHYGMRIPNFGNGDTTIKRAENKNLPSITDIGMVGDSIFIELSDSAKIEFVGQGGEVQQNNSGSVAKYRFKDNDTYIRINVNFENGVSMFSNPFFRYDQEPFNDEKPKISIIKTILWVGAWGAIFAILLISIIKIIRVKLWRK